MSRDMSDLITTCNICAAMPDQDEPRMLRWWWGSRDVEEIDQDKVLVIDDCPDKRDVRRAVELARDLVRGTQFTYTTTIRCDYVLGELTADGEKMALNRCAVWTHQLLANRLLILSTLNGLHQMRITERVTVPGDLWLNHRLGAILCIPPLYLMTGKEMGTYQSKVMRVLKGEVAVG